jgi:hypothetical protein
MISGEYFPMVQIIPISEPLSGRTFTILPWSSYSAMIQQPALHIPQIPFFSRAGLFWFIVNDQGLFFVLRDSNTAVKSNISLNVFRSL